MQESVGENHQGALQWRMQEGRPRQASPLPWSAKSVNIQVGTPSIGLRSSPFESYTLIWALPYRLNSIQLMGMLTVYSPVI